MPSHPDRVRRSYDVPVGAMVPYFRGKRGSELTRDELIRAYGSACEALALDRRWGNQVLEVDRMLEDVRRRMT